jgi:hypothetical protein
VQAKLVVLQVSGDRQSASSVHPAVHFCVMLLQNSPRAHWPSVEQRTGGIPHSPSSQD